MIVYKSMVDGTGGLIGPMLGHHQFITTIQVSEFGENRFSNFRIYKDDERLAF